MLTSTNLEAQLDQATSQYLKAAVKVSRDGQVALPRLLRSVAHMLSDSSQGVLLDWVAQRLLLPQRDALKAAASDRKGPMQKGIVRFAPHIWEFRYILSS